MESLQQILCVDDDPMVRDILRKIFAHAKIPAQEAPNGEAALALIREQSFGAMVLDLRMPYMSGHEVLRRARAIDGDLPVIILTAYGDIEDAVRTVKWGAYDYMTKPFSNKVLLTKVMNAMKERALRLRPSKAEPFQERFFSLAEVMGHSQKVQCLAQEVARVAPTDFSILVLGETGVGKEVVARAVHDRSQRSSGPFVALDCGAIPETLIESELFGHEKGAFTGADRVKQGKFEAAAGGTLFLDEIANFPLTMQSKLLRVLQERCFYRVGGTKRMETDVRVLAATNQDLSLVQDAGFRSDLYYRLAEYVIRIPPLRQRREDLLFLVRRFLRLTNEELGKSVNAVTEEALNTLLSYDWPGNVRELRNCIRKAVLLAENEISNEHLGIGRGQCVFVPEVPLQITDMEKQSLKEIVLKSTLVVERAVLNQVLVRTKGNKALAARLLKVDYKTLHTKAKKYGL